MGAAAAVIIIKKERDLVEHFQRVGAISPQTARARDEIGVDGGTAWFRLVDDAVVRSADNGRFYIDVLTWEALERRRKRVRMVALIIAALAVAFTIFATATARR
jgi:hypothetical protein